MEFKPAYPLRIVIPCGEWDEEDSIFLCPVCGTEWTHLDNVQLLAASGRSMAMHAAGEDETSGVVATSSSQKAQGRRHEIVILGSCENNHRFCLHFRQHKGNTFVALHEIKDDDGAA